MSETLTGLGESLAAAYQRQLDEWSALELSFGAYDLHGSLALADDLLRIDDSWQSCIDLLPALQSGFVPQNLVSASLPFDEPDAPKQHEPAERQHKRDKPYPFPAGEESSFTNVRFDAPGNPQQGVEPSGRYESKLPGTSNKTHDNTERSLPPYPGFDAADNPQQRADAFVGNELTIPDSSNRGYGANEDRLPPYPKLNSESVSEHYQERPFSISDTSSDNFVGKLLPSWLQDETKHSSSVPLNAQDETGQNAADQPVHNPFLAGTPRDKQSDGNNQYSDAIWSRQLGKLGDFASGLNLPSAKEAETPASPQRPSTTNPGAEQLMVSRTPQTQAQVSGLAPAQHMAMQEQAIQTTQHPNLPHSATDASEAISQHIQDTRTGMENTSFPAQQTQQPELDTDDLLEALTERILRDFRRYYP